MKFKIVTDSSCNLAPIQTESYESVPMKIITSKKEFVDDAHLDLSEMVETLKATTEKTGTSCPNAAEYLNAFEEDNKDKDKGILVFTISRNLSGSYQSAMIAKNDFEGDSYVFDTLSAGPGSGILIEKAQEYMENTDDFDEMVNKMNDYVSHTHLIFALKSIQNLINNGRVNPIVGKALGLLGIRIIGCADEEGKFKTLAKAKGKIKTLKKIYELIKENGYHGGKVKIDHSYNEEDANSLKEIIHSEYPDAIVEIGTTTGLCTYYAEEGGLMIAYEDL